MIVFQKRFFETKAAGPRVVIGIYDKNKKVIIHDNALGNNYEFSYSGFERMFSLNSRLILAVWPSDQIKGLIKSPDYSIPYPARTEAMDKLGPLLAENLSDVYAYWFKYSDAEKSKASYKVNAFYKVLADNPNFAYLPKAVQVIMLSEFALTYIHSPLNNYDEAIKIIKERVLPLNQNVGEAPEGWLVLPVDKLSFPYFVISLTYLKKGERTEAIKYYKEMLAVQNLVKDKIKDNAIFKNTVVFSRIPELEKAISSKK